MAQVQTTGTPGLNRRDDNHRWQTNPAARSAVWRRDQDTAVDSKPYWPPQSSHPKGAPTCFLIMTDDQGYGINSTFGRRDPDAAMDRIAKAGLRYTQFHTTALCLPPVRP